MQILKMENVYAKSICKEPWSLPSQINMGIALSLSAPIVGSKDVSFQLNTVMAFSQDVESPQNHSREIGAGEDMRRPSSVPTLRNYKVG